MYTKVGLVVWVAEDADPDTDPEAIEQDEIDGLAIRQLRNWTEQMLRVEDCTAGHRLLNILSKAVYHQAYDAGWNDADTIGESRLSAHAQPLWKDGYETGFAHRMSQLADEADNREET